jgi:hypothetical protein
MPGPAAERVHPMSITLQKYGYGLTPTGSAGFPSKVSGEVQENWRAQRVKDQVSTASLSIAGGGAGAKPTTVAGGLAVKLAKILKSAAPVDAMTAAAEMASNHVNTVGKALSQVFVDGGFSNDEAKTASDSIVKAMSQNASRIDLSLVHRSVTASVELEAQPQQDKYSEKLQGIASATSVSIGIDLQSGKLDVSAEQQSAETMTIGRDSFTTDAAGRLAGFDGKEFAFADPTSAEAGDTGNADMKAAIPTTANGRHVALRAQLREALFGSGSTTVSAAPTAKSSGGGLQENEKHKVSVTNDATIEVQGGVSQPVSDLASLKLTDSKTKESGEVQAAISPNTRKLQKAAQMLSNMSDNLRNLRDTLDQNASGTTDGVLRMRITIATLVGVATPGTGTVLYNRPGGGVGQVGWNPINVRT